MLSELLSNAIRYAPPLPAGEVRAAWWIDKAGIHVEVTDGRGDTEPQRINDTHPESIGGRGLRDRRHPHLELGRPHRRQPPHRPRDHPELIVRAIVPDLIGLAV